MHTLMTAMRAGGCGLRWFSGRGRCDGRFGAAVRGVTAGTTQYADVTTDARSLFICLAPRCEFLFAIGLIAAERGFIARLRYARASIGYSR